MQYTRYKPTSKYLSLNDLQTQTQERGCWFFGIRVTDTVMESVTARHEDHFCCFSFDIQTVVWEPGSFKVTD